MRLAEIFEVSQSVHPTLTSKKLGWTRRRTCADFLLFSGEVRNDMDVER